MFKDIEEFAQTHYVCENRLKKEGSKAKCCDCYPHEGCGQFITSQSLNMEKANKLKQYIEKGIENGWKWKKDVYFLPYEQEYQDLTLKDYTDKNNNLYLSLIFNPFLAKAVFGKEKGSYAYDKKYDGSWDAYKYHLHQALDELIQGQCPVDYLYKEMKLLS